MPVCTLRYPIEEIAQRGDEIYNRAIKSVVEPDQFGKWVAVDVETGAWEMGDSEIEASDHIFARNPDAQIFMARVGYRFTRRFGGGRRLR